MRRPPPERTARPLATAVAALGALALLTGCMTGQRPRLDTSAATAGALTGDVAVDEVLTLLDTVNGAVFTAEYSVEPSTGAVTTAVVTQVGPGSRSVTIGNVRFITDASGTRTCRVDTGRCETGIQPARVSDTNLTPDFVFGDIATRLRIDAQRNTSASSPSTTELAGQAATCVAVPVSGGTKQYCSLPNGVVAQFTGGDVRITLTSYRPQAEPALLSI